MQEELLTSCNIRDARSKLVCAGPRVQLHRLRVVRRHNVLPHLDQEVNGKWCVIDFAGFMLKVPGGFVGRFRGLKVFG